jgi:hypothetical protein
MKLRHLAISLLPLFVSCASICAPGPDMVSVSSDPLGAKIYLDSRLVGTTPAVVPIDRGSKGVIELQMDGYKTARIDRDEVLNGWFFPGSLTWILLWPGVPISMIVDLSTGNQGKYSTAPLYAKLERGSGVVDVDERMTVATNDMPEHDVDR